METDMGVRDGGKLCYFMCGDSLDGGGVEMMKKDADNQNWDYITPVVNLAHTTCSWLDVPSWTFRQKALTERRETNAMHSTVTRLTMLSIFYAVTLLQQNELHYANVILTNSSQAQQLAAIHKHQTGCLCWQFDKYLDL